MIKWINYYFGNRKLNKMLLKLELQVKVISGSENKLQKQLNKLVDQKFNISENQTPKLKYSQHHTYYTNNIVYAISPEFEQYFESVRSKLIDNKVYINIEARFKSQKEFFFAVYNSIDTLVEKLNKEIEIQTKSAQEFHLEIMTIREDYFTHSKFVQLTDRYRNTFDYFSSGDISGISDNLKEGTLFYNELSSYRTKWNKEYILKEIQESGAMLSNIDGKSLDQQQRLAVITDEDHNLVLAGAGSGKTLTIAGKVKYLVTRKNIKPEEILLISFTKKSADEMVERIGKKLHISVSVKTFHALGLEIIAKEQQSKPIIFGDLSKVIHDYMKDRIFEDGQQIRNIIEFFGYYLSIPKDYTDFDNLGEYNDFHRNMDFETLKGKMSKLEFTNQTIQQTRSRLKTISGETVKSFEEIMIANFLFLNSVNYVYEQDYPVDTRTEFYRQYKPDFYLPDYDIYIEHFGVDEHQRTPWLSHIEEQKYVDGMNWKKGLHDKYDTKLIESFSYYNKQGILLDKLREHLLAKGVKFKEANYIDIFNSVYRQDQDKYFNEFVKLLSTFINLFKSSGCREQQFDDFIEQNKKKLEIPFLKRRTELFLSLVKPIYAYYQNHLLQITAIDFNDMINQATDMVKMKQLDFPYKYIIIDEYQDISKSRFQLIEAIKERTHAKVMCVGDDWQSIFRFAGSDIQLFTNFGDYFGVYELMKIEQTYRNSQQLISIASNFVMRNKGQLNKNLKSFKENNAPIQILGYQKGKGEALRSAIELIVDEYGEHSEILILGRNKFDIHFLDEEVGFRVNQDKSEIHYSKYNNLEIRFLTTHRSKGLEADHVILLNGENSLVGFPNKISDDPVLSWVLTDKELFEFAEERRLFYVALTRTKKRISLQQFPN